MFPDKEASVISIKAGAYETLGRAGDTYASPSAQKLNQKVVDYLIDALDPFYALDPVEVCNGLQYLTDL